MQRALGLFLAVVLAVLAVFAFRRPVPESVPGQAGTAPTSSASDSPSSAPSDGTSPTDGSGGLAATGPGITEPGISVVAQPDASGSLEVLERVKLSSPVRSLALSPPQAAGTGVTGVNPSVSGFQAQADGLVVAGTPAPASTAGLQRIDLAAPATQISMRYRLDGAVGRSQPAPVGRGLALVAPLTADPALRDLPVVVEVVGAGVHNLVCPKLPSGNQLCGRQSGRVWSTTAIPLGNAIVVAQLDLPQPGVQ